uniref:hypothetical protein n=1 Tax=Wolbachia endosymbiont of Wuchereria bancrofti TaxID=96496 RepID=UPI000348E271|nr:hypothetical protein [Wolbachia endosymbiont of Wuchereria bancrofti]
MIEILLKKLEITKEQIKSLLEENNIRKLKLALDNICRRSGKNMEETIKEKEIEEIVASRFSHEYLLVMQQKEREWDVAYKNLRSLPCRRFTIFL